VFLPFTYSCCAKEGGLLCKLLCRLKFRAETNDYKFADYRNGVLKQLFPYLPEVRAHAPKRNFPNLSLHPLRKFPLPTYVLLFTRNAGCQLSFRKIRPTVEIVAAGKAALST
jgi:hypothetical protein